MTILAIIGIICVWCLVLWLAKTQVSDPTNKKIMIIVATVLLCLVILWAVGLLGFLSMSVGRR